VNIIWDENKNEWLVINRGISFEEISAKLTNNDYLDILENPTRKDQFYFVLNINNYIWIVPFLLNEKEKIVLKTAFPSRKFQKKYKKFLHN